MDFVDPLTGDVKKLAEDGGQMNYVCMKPGVTIVSDFGDKTLLLPQERYAVNLVEGSPQRHYELPAGGIEEGADQDSESIIEAAAREFSEESGRTAEEFVVLGSPRGAYSHPGVMTHRNVTVLARGTKLTGEGAQHEATEILGQPEQFTWGETDDMSYDEHGMWTPEGYKIISSAPTIASLALARIWRERHADSRPKVIDLGALGK